MKLVSIMPSVREVGHKAKTENVWLAEVSNLTKEPNLTFGRITSRLGKADASIVLLSLLCDFAGRL